MKSGFAALALLLGACASARADAVDSALSTELGRAMTQLRREGYPSPYYLSLTAIDVDSWEQRCPMGAASFTGRYEQRLLVPDLRVGDYSFDNRPVNNVGGFQGRQAALDDDEFALRHALWRQLDAAYKTASADYLRKQALRLSRGKTAYDTDDLTREEPRERRAARPTNAWKTADLSRLCLEPGRVLRRVPGLLTAETTIRLRRQWSRLRDSEGSAVDFGRDVAEIEIEAVDISSDGMKLSVARRFVATTPEALPSPSLIKEATRDMAEDLRRLKLAASTSPFNAPALLDPSVSAVVVLSLGLRLAGEEQRNPSGAQTFGGKLGKLVLPPDFTLIDDPTRRDHEGRRLAGHYEFDDQGVPPQKVTLVEKGVLKSMLLSRYPVVGLTRSNGHGRAFAGYPAEGRPGSLFLSSEKRYSEAELLDMLRAECRKRGKPYGIWVRKLRNFTQQQGTGGHTSIRLMAGLVYLVDAAMGDLTLVRDLDLVGTPLVLMSNLRAAGQDVGAHDLVQSVSVSVVVPSLLFADAELQRSETRPERQPILPPPLDEPAAKSRRIPFVPVVPHVHVRRYIVRGYNRLPPKLEVGGVQDFRQRLEGADAFLDFKVAAPTLPDLGNALRGLDAAVDRLADGLRVDKVPLSPTMTASSYQSRYGSGWPQ